MVGGYSASEQREKDGNSFKLFRKNLQLKINL